MNTPHEFWIRISLNPESDDIEIITFGDEKFREIQLRVKEYEDGNPAVLLNLKGGPAESNNYRGWLKTLNLTPEREKQFTDLIYSSIVTEFTKKGYMKP